jgi:hypothetical protein
MSLEHSYSQLNPADQARALEVIDSAIWDLRDRLAVAIAGRAVLMNVMMKHEVVDEA